MEQEETAAKSYTALYPDGKFEKIVLGEVVNRGGAAGKIYLVQGYPNLVAKVFHTSP